ncbi:hypothetical protein [Paenibacillus gallinarum]|uniref:Uncharacterized protein n=1 Tax=Paenibacillus gallinarum TaxID=2762232 RepID=A0ABR8T3T3_9BACL|nr:hypothetical protein [Paenibacillus gallinarum]MBD7970198.1 hypothetical protein [Paenibacillus gallinarum]
MPWMALMLSLFFVRISGEKERGKDEFSLTFYKMMTLTVFYKNIDQYGSFS